MPRLGFVRPELSRMLARYELIRDCLIGSEAVKKRDRLYLPMPNESDQSPENKARYKGYKARAVFYNFTARTLQGYIGQIQHRQHLYQHQERYQEQR